MPFRLIILTMLVGNGALLPDGTVRTYTYTQDYPSRSACKAALTRLESALDAMEFPSLSKQQPVIAYCIERKRTRAKHLGIRKPGGFPKTFKGRPIKFKVGGGVVYADNGEPVR